MGVCLPGMGVRWQIGLAVAGWVVVMVIVGLAGMKDDEPAAPSSTSAPSTSRTLPGSPIPPSPGEAYLIGSGGWLSGVYEAPGGSGCSWVIQRDLAGSVVESGSAPRVALRDGQYFTSDGCGVWKRVARL